MIIVTGGAGFIGSCVVRTLNDLGRFDIVIVDNIASTEKWMNIRNKKFIKYVHKSAFLMELPSYDNVEAIIHLGAQSSTTEKDFDYLSVDTVKRTFSKLEKAGYLLVGNYNKDPRDKTKWYTINDKKLEELYLELNQRKQEKEREILEQVSKSAMPNALGQNAPMEEGKINQCNEAFSTDAFDENLPVHYGNLHEPLPEITTNNSSKITSDISTENSSHLPIYERDLFYSGDGMEEGRKQIKSYKSCLEELRESTGYNEHM